MTGRTIPNGDSTYGCSFAERLEDSTRRRGHLTHSGGGRWQLAVILAALWVIFAAQLCRSPIIYGMDPIIRLFFIDRALIGVDGNVWLPLPQFAFQLVNFFADSAAAYKWFMLFISGTAIALTAAALAERFSRLVAVIACSFFFLDQAWLRASASPYQEPFALMFVAASVLCLKRAPRFAAALLLICASFCRPELLLAAPILSVMQLMLTRSLKQSLSLAAVFVPATLFYLWLASYGLEGFKLDDAFDGSRLWLQLRVRWALLFGNSTLVTFGLCSLVEVTVSLSMVLFGRKSLRDEPSLMIAIFLALFFGLFSVSAPGLHAALNIHARQVLYFRFGVFVLAARLADRACSPPVRTAAAYTAVLVWIAHWPVNVTDASDRWLYRAAVRSEKVLEARLSEERSLAICKCSPAPIMDVAGRSLGVYLRFHGWKLSFSSCAEIDAAKGADQHVLALRLKSAASPTKLGTAAPAYRLERKRAPEVEGVLVPASEVQMGCGANRRTDLQTREVRP